MSTENERTLALLREVLPSPRWDTTEFLDWVYDHNPVGPLLPSNVDRDEQRVCHIGGVPMPLRSSDLDGTALLLLNSSTSPEEQRHGTYAKTILRLNEMCRDLGHLGLFGVTNAESTGPVLRGAGASWQCSLPVHLFVPWRLSNQVTSRAATSAWLASDEFTGVAGRLDRHPTRDLTYRWSAELLRWRLGFPGADYSIHWSDKLVSVSTRSDFRGIPVTVMLKFLPREGQTGPLSPRSHIAAACRHHRTPVALYAGINRHVPVSGIRLAQDRLPAPLNLVMLSAQTDALPQHRFLFDTFEFLDFDAF